MYLLTICQVQLINHIGTFISSDGHALLFNNLDDKSVVWILWAQTISAIQNIEVVIVPKLPGDINYKINSYLGGKSKRNRRRSKRTRRR